MKKILLVVIMLLFTVSLVQGEEGMWLLSQLKGLKLADKGFKITAEDIYSKNGCLAKAVVSLGGGTAEFVSPNGLILTNHHVAFGAVQRASTKGTDYITNGFLAKSFAEEIEAPGYSAYVLVEIKDVTSKFRSALKVRDLVKRELLVKKKMKKITDKAEKKGRDISAKVASMLNGRKYILFVHKRFDDVRVVYVPPAAIGNYGGDIDNWMWPRHTGDFSFMRVYMSPDGKGSKYSKNNVPYKTENWLKIAKTPLKEGDQTCIIGYPGRTTRYRTSVAVNRALNFRYPVSIKLFKEVIQILEKAGKDSQIAKAKVAGLHKGLNNAMKNYQGNVDGMKRFAFLEKKKAYEKKLMDFVNTKPALKKKYGNVLAEIADLYKKHDAFKERDMALLLGTRLSGTLFGAAYNAFSTASERVKPKSIREPGFSEKKVKRTVARLRYTYMSFYAPVDKVLLKKALGAINQLPKEQKVKGFEKFFAKKDIGKFADKAIDKSILNDPKKARSLFFMTPQKLLALNDPLINLAAALYKDIDKLKNDDKVFEAKIKNLRKNYIDLLYAWKGSSLYPDANSTVRFSYGRVKGYKPRDAVTYKPFTTLKGLSEKDTGIPPFDMPKKLKEIYLKRDYGRWIDKDLNDVPVAFTHMVDSTGGNSGSPVLNASGELVGILFDGNYEAMTGGWQYDTDIQRTISVDIRYVLFIVEKLAKAGNLLKELNI